jgi:hypothetical protein
MKLTRFFPKAEPGPEPGNFTNMAMFANAEALARHYHMSLELSLLNPGQWQARTHRAVKETTIYGHGETLQAAIFDCAERVFKIEGALKGDAR